MQSKIEKSEKKTTKTGSERQSFGASRSIYPSVPKYHKTYAPDRKGKNKQHSVLVLQRKTPRRIEEKLHHAIRRREFGNSALQIRELPPAVNVAANL